MYGLIDCHTETKIQKTRFPKHLCDELMEMLLPTIHEGENKFELNIKGVERSPWHMHLGRENTDSLVSLREHMVLYPQHLHGSDKGGKWLFTWQDLWIMNGLSEEGFVEPHCHTKTWGGLSFSLYLKLPKGKSSLSFMSVDERNDAYHRHVVVEEGDMLTFPANMLHYSKDVEPNRIVVSGNAQINYILPEKEEFSV